jgi:hypothetical protein
MELDSSHLKSNKLYNKTLFLSHEHKTSHHTFIIAKFKNINMKQKMNQWIKSYSILQKNLLHIRIFQHPYGFILKCKQIHPPKQQYLSPTLNFIPT